MRIHLPPNRNCIHISTKLKTAAISKVRMSVWFGYFLCFVRFLQHELIVLSFRISAIILTRASGNRGIFFVTLLKSWSVTDLLRIQDGFLLHMSAKLRGVTYQKQYFRNFLFPVLYCTRHRDLNSRKYPMCAFCYFTWIMRQKNVWSYFIYPQNLSGVAKTEEICPCLYWSHIFLASGVINWISWWLYWRRKWWRRRRRRRRRQ
jgi:hypothetical protein